MTPQKTIRLLVGVTICLAGSFLAAYYVLGHANFLIGQSSRLLLITQGTSFSRLQEQLDREGYLANKNTFSWVAYILRYDKKVAPGVYRIQPNMNNWQVIRILRGGIQEPVKLVLNAIANKQELAVKITQDISVNPVDFEALLNDTTFLTSYGFTPDNVLTMFIPNTYEVYWTITAQRLFRKMYREYQRFWSKERLQKAQEISLTPSQVYILASIVAKETSISAEYPIIAGVYINRLKKDMLLQSCPTALYAANELTAKRVLYKHIRCDSPYNTYRYKGLPPGPITMPPIAAIDAVLNYQVHDYLYLVSQGQFSDRHHFATTFKQHQQYIRQYRRAAARRGISPS